MRTEDDARHRPIPGDLHLCHYIVSELVGTVLRRVVSIDNSLTVADLRTGSVTQWTPDFWARSGLTFRDVAAGGFERWIPAPEAPARDPATHPQVCDRWAYDAPEGIVDIEVLEVCPNKVGFRYGTSYLNWSPDGFKDICKHWRIVTIAKTAPGGNP